LGVAFLIAIPAAVNYRGVRSGANLSTVMTLTKLAPLALLIVFGLRRFALQPQMIHTSEFTTPGWSNWVRAVALLIFPLGGWEDSLIPTGEVREPRRTIPFALGTGLVACTVIFVLLQFITVATVGPNATERSLAEAGSVLLGHDGAALVAIAIMVASYGWLSADLLNAPRLAYSLAAEGDFPTMLARIHPRFHTPAVAILAYAFIGWTLAVSGTFLFALALSAGSMMIYYAGMSASLIRLRAASRCGRVQDSLRARAQYCRSRYCPGIDDRTDEPRASPDVCYRTACNRQLALGEMAACQIGIRTGACLNSIRY